MLKGKVLAVSIFCLPVSFTISALIIANSINNARDYISGSLNNVSQGLDGIGSSIYSSNDDSVVYGRSTYNLAAAAAYLGITELNLMELVNAGDKGIPYIKTGNDYVFSKKAIDKWLETARIELK